MILILGFVPRAVAIAALARRRHAKAEAAESAEFAQRRNSNLF
jgi:hypothetical protein